MLGKFGSAPLTRSAPGAYLAPVSLTSLFTIAMCRSHTIWYGKFANIFKIVYVLKRDGERQGEENFCSPARLHEAAELHVAVCVSRR